MDERTTTRYGTKVVPSDIRIGNGESERQLGECHELKRPHRDVIKNAYKAEGVAQLYAG